MNHEINSLTPPPFVTPVPLKPKSHKVLKVLGVVVAVLLVLVFVFLNLPRVLTILRPGDAKLLDNSGVYLQRVSVPDRDNAYFLFAKLSEDSVYLPSGQKTFDLDYTNFIKPVVWNQGLVDSVIGKNAAGLELFSKAANRKYFQYPPYADPKDIQAETPVLSLGALRHLSRFQALRALSLTRQGDTSAALAEAVKLNRLGHLIIVGHNGFLGGLVGMSMQRLGSETILHILENEKVSKGALLNTLASLEGTNDNSEGYKDMFRADYTNVVNSIDKTINSQLQAQVGHMIETGETNAVWAKYAKYGYYYKPNQTKNLYTQLYAREVAAIGTTCALGELSEITQNQPVTWKLVFTENAIGRLLFSVTGLSLGSAITKQCENDLAFSAAKAALGLRLYKIDHGALPTTLGVLVPAYMAQLPGDPFTRTPLRYDPKKKILYSLGALGRDLGGSTGPDWARMENPTFNFSF